MLRAALVTLALAVGIGSIVGWAFEIPRIDGTVDAGELVIRAGTYGAAFGLVVGLALSFLAERFIGKFQNVATAILLCTVAAPLLALVSNRLLSADQTEVVELPVKQVTAEWSGRGLTREALDAPAEAYSVYVEAPEGLTRLRQEGGPEPVVDATRTLPVRRNPGYWGYPLYELAPRDTARVPSFE